MSADFMPYAGYEDEQRGEQGGEPSNPNPKTIGVFCTSYVQADRYLTSDEARMLAADLIEAARQADNPDEDEHECHGPYGCHDKTP